jgi:delta1-piperideine-2-carboxylate reductase
MMVNSMATVVPHGGTRPVFGTNPIAFAAPRAGADPLVFDLATAAWSNGDVQIARREGRPLPAGVGIDRHGNPTTDPAAVLEGGALLTFGGYKGAAISMMIEIMAAGLGGGDFSFEVDWSKHPGATTPRTAQTIILIDPARGQPCDFTARIEVLLAAVREAGQERLPADRRYANRRESKKLGVELADKELAEFRRLAGT